MRDQHVRGRRQEHAELIGDEAVATGAVGEQAELMLLDAVFGFATHAVIILIEDGAGVGQIGDDKAWIGLAVLGSGQIFGLANDATHSAPCAGGIKEFMEESMGLAVDGAPLSDRVELELNVALQDGIACQAEQIKDVVSLAPVHDAMSAKAAVAAEHDADVGPFLAKALNQKLKDRPGVQGSVDVGRPQVGDQQVIAAMNVERQEAVVVVVAVEEAIFLMSVHEVVGGVEIEDEFLRRRGMFEAISLDESFDEGDGEVKERFALDAIFESAESGRRSELGRVVGTGMIGDGLPEGIVAELLMIVEIFVAAGDGEDPLSEQGPLRMDNKSGLTGIGNDAIEGIDQSELLIGLPEQEGAGVGGEGSAREIGDEIASKKAGERDGS